MTDNAKRMGMSRVRIDLTNVLNDVATENEMLIITDRGREIGALIPMALADRIREYGGAMNVADRLDEYLQAGL